MSKIFLALLVLAAFCVISTLAATQDTAQTDEYTIFGGEAYVQNYEPYEPERVETAVKTTKGKVIVQNGASSATTTGYNGAAKGQQYSS